MVSIAVIFIACALAGSLVLRVADLAARAAALSNRASAPRIAGCRCPGKR
jgi:hypothetical protein